MGPEKKRKRKERNEAKIAGRQQFEDEVEWRLRERLRPKGIGSPRLYGDSITSGSLKARRRRQTSAPHFPPNRAEDALLNR